ncbi:MAG: RibD family protein [Hyphomicrobiales bacterium]
MSDQNAAIKFAKNDPFDAVRGTEPLVIAQLGQSIDGRIATINGHSKYINHKDGLTHLHRLRANVDAVIVGVGTVNDDDPRLTVRLCEGENPKRVIIDPHGRVFKDAQIFNGEGPEVIIITRNDMDHPLRGRATIVPLDHDNGRISPKDIIKALAADGMSRLLVEGGARTVSGFLNNDALDRLHMIVAPLILGSGQPGLSLSSVKTVQEGLQPTIELYSLGHDILYDCNLKA